MITKDGYHSLNCTGFTSYGDTLHISVSDDREAINFGAHEVEAITTTPQMLRLSVPDLMMSQGVKLKSRDADMLAELAGAIGDAADAGHGVFVFTDL